ncbi:MAG: TlpA family protein disulfide reductase [Planctomycetia bacterium]|nr:TlpA family protein disulfide reductase [Planctomycetia bacterium]
MKMTVDRQSLVAVLGVAALLGLSSARADELAVGSKAPAIDIEHWVQKAGRDADGKFAPITEFAPGQVYVVEFWATWCPPCRTSMPHLSKLQEEYGEKGVTIISVSDEDLETVEKFLETDAEGGKTYGEVTKNYLLTTDPDGSVSRAYMEAAGQNGIPCAFIVGKTGEIEWIGHPMQMDAPLEGIVAGTFDREAFAAAAREMKEVQTRFREVVALMQGGKPAEAVALIDGWIPELKSTEVKGRLRSIRQSIAMQAGGALALEAFGAAAKDADGSAEQLNELAWNVVMAANAGMDVSKDLVAAAVVAAERGLVLEPKNGNLLDTLAHLYAQQGDLEKALATQRKALENASEASTESIRDYLEELEVKVREAKKATDK